MDEQWENDLDLLTQSGKFGFYKFGEVIQIILIDKKSNAAWNYFTNITFSSEATEREETKFVTKHLEKVNKQFQLGIAKYTLTIEQFKKLYREAIDEQKWNYVDSIIDSSVQLDNVFPTRKKFIPEYDPRGAKYHLSVPIEEFLYGSNYLGNYYIIELFSTKEYIHEFTSKEDCEKIQCIIRACGLNYQLNQLTDRIGNIVCKFKQEIVQYSPLCLNNSCVGFQFSLSNKIKLEKYIGVCIKEENDKLIYKNELSKLALKPGDTKEVEAEPNNCKITISLTDLETGLLVFSYVGDYSVKSNYFSEISLPYDLSSSLKQNRVFKIDEQEIKISLNGFEKGGTKFFSKEIYDVGMRQENYKNLFLESKHYFHSYEHNEHDQALCDVRDILNHQIFWDLQEIWLIDPYLAPKDILSTAMYCKKPNICIKCLTDLHNLKRNSTNENVELDSDASNTSNEEHEQNICNNTNIKNEYHAELEEAIPLDTDVKLEYRTINKNNGSSFHDRYLILKYQFNRTRVWSLGTSINSLGRQHHIIQIVEYPELIAELFKKFWDKSEGASYLIYKTHNL